MEYGIEKNSYRGSLLFERQYLSTCTIGFGGSYTLSRVRLIWEVTFVNFVVICQELGRCVQLTKNAHGMWYFVIYMVVFVVF